MSDTHEVRELRFKVKQLSKCCGKQGETIHLLRAELAEVRELNSKLERGELRRLERRAEALYVQLGNEMQANAALREKLTATEVVEQ